MQKTDIARLGQEDVVKMIGKDWMLITAGTTDNYNMMTASWGGIGFLWGKPVAFIFVRPERHTYGFVEQAERFTLSFYGEEQRETLKFCGAHSGRDCDKAHETGLRPVATEGGSVTFEQARLTLECRKAYRTELRAEEFIDREALDRWYGNHPGGSLHAVYIGEIEAVYE